MDITQFDFHAETSRELLEATREINTLKHQVARVEKAHDEAITAAQQLGDAVCRQGDESRAANHVSHSKFLPKVHASTKRQKEMRTKRRQADKNALKEGRREVTIYRRMLQYGDGNGRSSAIKKCLQMHTEWKKRQMQRDSE